MNAGIRCRVLVVTMLLCLGLSGVGGEGAQVDQGLEQADRGVRVIGDLFACAVRSATGLIMVGARGRIYLSEDAGRTWVRVASGTGYALAGVSFPDAEHGWIVGQAGLILHSVDRGRTWQRQVSGVDTYLLDVDFLDARRGMAVGEGATVVRTTDGGRTWTRAGLKESTGLVEDLNLFAVSVIDDRHACVVGDRGTIFVSEDDGQHWSEVDSPVYDKMMMEGRVLYALARDSGTLYAVGVDGALVVSRDLGKTWIQGDTGLSKADLFCIDMKGGFGMAAGSGGQVIRTSDGGASWQPVAVPERVERFWLSGLGLGRDPAGKVVGLVVGQSGTFALLREGALSW